jgi:hypothetical protein
MRESKARLDVNFFYVFCVLRIFVVFLFLKKESEIGEIFDLRFHRFGFDYELIFSLLLDSIPQSLKLKSHKMTSHELLNRVIISSRANNIKKYQINS